MVAGSVLGPFMLIVMLTACNRQDLQMRMWYDRSEAARAACDTNRQMAFLLQAAQRAEKTGDQRKAGEIFLSECLVFKEFNDLGRAMSAAERARLAFLAAKDNPSRYDAVLEEAELNIKSGKLSGAGVWLDHLHNEERSLSGAQRHRLEELDMLYSLLLQGDISSAEAMVKGASCGFSDEVFRLDLFARSKEIAGDVSDAQSISASRDRMLAQAGNRETKMFAISADLIRQQRAGDFRHSLMVILILVFVVLGVVLETIHLKRQVADRIIQTKNMEEEVLTAKEEIRRLEQLLSRASLPEDLRSWVTERISILNKISARILIPEGEKSHRAVVEQLLSKDDSEAFADELYQQFVFLNPGMASYLESCRLTSRERLVCVLLCFGLKVKEIAGFLKLSRQRCYNIQNDIRKKLGFQDQRKNLQTILTEKMDELQRPEVYRRPGSAKP